MRATKVKRLRRYAEVKTIGWPLIRYQINDRQTQIELVPSCTRKVYQELKHETKTHH